MKKKKGRGKNGKKGEGKERKGEEKMRVKPAPVSLPSLELASTSDIIAHITNLMTMQSVAALGVLALPTIPCVNNMGGGGGGDSM